MDSIQPTVTCSCPAPSNASNLFQFPIPGLNTFYIGPSTQHVTTTTILNGIVIDPYDTGLMAVLGVPNLAPNTEVNLDTTLAVELDVGCMTIGMYAEQNLAFASSSFDIFQTNGTWRKYTGSDYMFDILANFTDQIRSYVLPFFNASSIDSSGYIYTNDTKVIFSSTANVGSWFLPTVNPSFTTTQSDILGNCTAALQNRLGIVYPYDVFNEGNMCSLLGLGGGVPALGFSRMICATATQVNIVAVKVARNGDSSLSVGVTRLPSGLHYLRAGYLDPTIVLWQPIK